MYDVGADRRAVRAAAGPDDRLQGAQGRPDRQHPGRARRRREDRGEADPRVRRPRLAVRAARRGHAREAARQAARAPRPGPDGPRAVDDRPRPAGRDRSRGGPARRLRPRHGRPAVPRVRVPDAHRALAADGRRDRGGADGAAAVGRRERLRPGGAGRRTAGGLGPGPGERPSDRPAASSSFASTSTRSQPRRHGVRRRRAGGGRRGARSSRPTTCPTALAAAIVDPGRIEVVGEAGVDGLEPWLAAQPAVGVSLVADDPRPRRGTPLALAVVGTDGRVGRGRRRRGGRRPAPPARAHPASRSSGHEVKPVLVASFADDAGRGAADRSPSTRRSPRTSSTRRCAARRSPTSSPSTSTRSCRPRPSCRRPPAPASRRCPRWRCASRSSAGSTRSRASSGSSARSSCR